MAAYATSVFENAEIILTYDGQEIFRDKSKLSPVDTYKRLLKQQIWA